MQRIEPSAFRRMPWKNGGGETAEIAIAPIRASANDFDWRVSTARVATPGPFSVFHGVDRSLAVLSGQGLRLVLNPTGGGESVLLSPTSAPFVFAGDIPVHADLMGGAPVVDFNVMTRRNAFKHVLRRTTLSETAEVEGDAIVLYCLAGSANCRDEGSAIDLTVGDALVAGDAGKQDVTTIRIAKRGTESCELLVAQIFALRLVA